MADAFKEALDKATEEFSKLPQREQDILRRACERLAEPIPAVGRGYSAWP